MTCCTFVKSVINLTLNNQQVFSHTIIIVILNLVSRLLVRKDDVGAELARNWSRRPRKQTNIWSQSYKIYYHSNLLLFHSNTIILCYKMILLW